MSLNYAAIVKDILTWATAAKIVAGGVIHKVYTWVVAEIAKAKAEAAKVEAEAKKIEADVKTDIKKL
jgi:hypothetical protein